MVLTMMRKTIRRNISISPLGIIPESFRPAFIDGAKADGKVQVAGSTAKWVDNTILEAGSQL
jgi:hypothetical protein